MEHIISYIQESWNFRDSYKTCVKIGACSQKSACIFLRACSCFYIGQQPANTA